MTIIHPRCKFTPRVYICTGVYIVHMNEALEILAEFNLLQKLHICTRTSVCATNFGPLGEIGANFSLQLASRTQFAKINS